VAEPFVSIVVPVYNSAATLSALEQRLAAVLQPLDPHYEIILIDDGSSDDSWAALRRLRAHRPDHVVAVQLMRNYGQHNALMCGFRRARGRYVVTIDDDLQNPPEEIPRLLEAIQGGDLDLVYGQPSDRQHAGWRNAGSKLINRFYRLVFRTPVSLTSFRIIRRELVQCTLNYDLNFTFVDGLLAWNTQRLGAVEVAHHPRHQGRSGYSLVKLIALALNLFTNFSLWPLRLISFCGLGSAGLGFLAAAYFLVCWLLGAIKVPGYASLIVAVLVLGGVQLLALGVMGEYLGRLHLNVNRKPQYVERQALTPVADQERSVRAA
jgi:glycosyltransferase involved in cell wall biosynthesis